VTLPRDEIDRRLQIFMDLCQKNGFKATPQRLEIFRQVAQTEEHPDADVICARVRKRMPTVSLDTVYRTLAFLEENGLIQKVSRVHSSARFDANTLKHHHFICTECGGIWDFYSNDLDRFQLPTEAAALGAVTSVQVELRGVCAACRAARNKLPGKKGRSPENRGRQ